MGVQFLLTEAKTTDLKKQNLSSSSQNRKMGKDNLCKRLFGVFTSLWLIADMAFDIQQIIEYSGEECLQKRGEKDCNWYFYTSLLAVAGPVVVTTAIALLIFFCTRDGGGTSEQENQQLAGVLFFSTFVPALLYALSPLFHIVQAFCNLCGCKPEGEGGMKTFWTLTGILKLVEQILEALPQLVIACIYLNQFFDVMDDMEKANKIITAILSAGSLLWAPFGITAVMDVASVVNDIANIGSPFS